jgi:hypothetical protein
MHAHTHCSDNNSPLRVVGGGEDNWQNDEDPRGDQLGADDLLIHELVSMHWVLFRYYLSTCFVDNCRSYV